MRDATGALASLLLVHIDEAELLLAESPGIEDRRGLLRWLEQAHGWRAATIQTLAARFDHLVVEEFRVALGTREPTSRRELGITAERRAMQRGIELLAALRGTQMV